MDALNTEIQQRWQDMFNALASGEDVAPTQRLRTEGLMESLVLTGGATPESLQEAMCASYQQAFGKTIAETFGEQWREFFPFPQIPAMARRAPVYPSTSD